MRTWMREKRLSLGLSQERLAYKADTCGRTVSYIEQGQRTPEPAIAKRLAAVLDEDWTRFYEDTK
ncbi:helix-turn-helix transcriptional regulator [Gehongia tenuis]|uniref:Helix-turn-helix transcriptional regulator n=1 Tax=Gehongia tenuis TaxID=2763655 RepID=A0A926HQ95_9FIRM|nr:helix-turn-helix transcriptional regulator [Gehongia tenuis]MBC8531993.1 helix-turn-helix transcriptional regulator [Gehongia tenuis]